MGSVIVGGARTPIGKLLGGLKDASATDLGGYAIAAALERSGISPAHVDYVVMGKVLQAGTGQISARQAAVMTATWPRTLARWLFAVAMPGVALGIALPLSGSIDQIPSPPFIAAIFVVAWFSGFRPAVLSIVLSAAAMAPAGPG